MGLEIAPLGRTIYIPESCDIIRARIHLVICARICDKNQRALKTRDSVRRTTPLFRSASLDRGYLCNCSRYSLKHSREPLAR